MNQIIRPVRFSSNGQREHEQREKQNAVESELVTSKTCQPARVNKLCEVCHANGLHDQRQRRDTGYGGKRLAPDRELFQNLRFLLRCRRNTLIFRQRRFRRDRSAAGRDHILRRDCFRQHIARNAVRGGRVEAVAAEKRARRSLGDDIAVKKQGAAFGILRAEFDIMADHQNRHAGRSQRPQNLPKRLLELRIKSLRRFVKE